VADSDAEASTCREMPGVGVGEYFLHLAISRAEFDQPGDGQPGKLQWPRENPRLQEIYVGHLPANAHHSP